MTTPVQATKDQLLEEILRLENQAQTIGGFGSAVLTALADHGERAIKSGDEEVMKKALGWLREAGGR